MSQSSGNLLNNKKLSKEEDKDQVDKQAIAPVSSYGSLNESLPMSPVPQKSKLVTVATPQIGNSKKERQLKNAKDRN